jgi:nucleotide-binding universal stress UspA family protein
VPEQTEMSDALAGPGTSTTADAAAGDDGRRMVVGMDGSPHAQAALEWVATLAEATGQPVEVIATWEWPTGFGANLVATADYDPHADAEALVADAVRAARTRHPTVAFVPLVVRGRPSNVLVDASSGADLLALGSRGHGELSGVLIGSVTEHCVAHAHCPVLVVRDGAEPPGRR